MDWGDENETGADQLAHVLNFSGSSGEEIYESDEEDISDAAEVDELAGLLDGIGDSDKEKNDDTEKVGDGEGGGKANGGDKAGVDEKTLAAENTKPGADEGEASKTKDKFKDGMPMRKLSRQSSKRRVRKKHRRSVSLTVPDIDQILSSPSSPGTDSDPNIAHLRSKSQELSTPDFFGLFESEEEKEAGAQETFKSLSLDYLLSSASKSSKNELEKPKTAPEPEPEPEAEGEGEGDETTKVEPIRKPLRKTHSRAKSMLSIPTEFFNDDETPVSDEAPSPSKHSRSKTFPPDDSTDFTTEAPSPSAHARTNSPQPPSSLSGTPVVKNAKMKNALNAFAAEASFRLSMSERSFSRKSSRTHLKATSMRARKAFKGHGYDHYRRSLNFAPKSYTYDHHGCGSAGVLQFRNKKIPKATNACSKFVRMRMGMISVIVVP